MPRLLSLGIGLNPEVGNLIKIFDTYNEIVVIIYFVKLILQTIYDLLHK